MQKQEPFQRLHGNLHMDSTIRPCYGGKAKVVGQIVSMTWRKWRGRGLLCTTTL